MNRPREGALLGMAVLLSLSACNIRVSIDANGEQVTGSGDTTSETREVADFDSVELSGEGRVIIDPANEASLIIEAEDNLLPYLESVVSGGRLVLSTRSGIDLDPRRDIVYRVGIRDLTSVALTGAGSFDITAWSGDDVEVELNGAGDVQVEDLRAATVRVEIGGVGKVELQGTVDEQQVVLSGVGSYEAGDLASRIADVESSGTGSATVWVSESLDVRLSGVGGVSYYGSPSVSEEVSGLGGVRSLGAK